MSLKKIPIFIEKSLRYLVRRTNNPLKTAKIFRKEALGKNYLKVHGLVRIKMSIKVDDI